MAHNRKFCTSIASLIVGRVRNDIKLCVKSRDLIEAILIEGKTLDSAPFRCIGLMYRYGTKNMFDVSTFLRTHFKLLYEFFRIPPVMCNH